MQSIFLHKLGQCEENTYLVKYGWLFTEEKADIMGKKGIFITFFMTINYYIYFFNE